MCPGQLGFLDTTPRHQLKHPHMTSAVSHPSYGSQAGRRLSSSCLAGTQPEDEPGNASLVLWVSPANSSEPCPSVQPFWWVSGRQDPRCPSKGGAGYVSYSNYWKWTARPVAGALWEETVPRLPQLDLNSRKSSGFLCLSRPLLIRLTLGILTHSQDSRFCKVC